MRHIHPFRAGVAVGTVIALWHACWVVLIGLGWAKPVLDFVLRLHFIQLQYQLEPYAAVTAAMLIGVTFCVGMSVGVVFALVWNSLVNDNAHSSAGLSARAGA